MGDLKERCISWQLSYFLMDVIPNLTQWEIRKLKMILFFFNMIKIAEKHLARQGKDPLQNKLLKKFKILLWAFVVGFENARAIVDTVYENIIYIRDNY